MSLSGRRMWNPWSADDGGPLCLLVLVMAPLPLSPRGQEGFLEWGSSPHHTDSLCPPFSGGPEGPLLPSFYPTTNQCPASIHPPKEWCCQFLLFSTLQMQTSVLTMQC